MNRLDDLVRATLVDRAEQAPSPIPVVNRVRAQRRQPARRGWLVAGAAAAATTAVVAVGITVSNSGSGSGQSTAVVAEGRTAEAYSVVLEHFLDDSYRHDDDGVPDTVLVLIRPEEDAGWAAGRPEVGDPIPPDVRDAVTAALADLTTVAWVDRFPPIDPGDTPETSDPVIRLGLLPSGDEVNVSVSANHGYDNGWLKTYVVSRDEDGHWRVTGADAPVGLT